VVNCFALDANDKIIEGNTVLYKQLAETGPTMAHGCCTCVLAHLFPGADALAKIANAIAALPAIGGCVDARGLTGTQQQTVATTVIVDCPVTLLLGAVHIKAIATPTFQVSAKVGPSTLTVLGLDPTAKVIEANQPNVTLFQFVGDFFDNDGDGAASFAVKRCGLWVGCCPAVAWRRGCGFRNCNNHVQCRLLGCEFTRCRFDSSGRRLAFAYLDRRKLAGARLIFVGHLVRVNVGEWLGSRKWNHIRDRVHHHRSRLRGRERRQHT
jgi:hypothetical protein